MPTAPGGLKAPVPPARARQEGVRLLTGHFVGRADELGSLEQILDELDRGCPGAIAVAGEPAAAGREHHPAGGPGCHRPLRPAPARHAQYSAGPDTVPAQLDTGTLRALDARVEIAGQDARPVAGG
jgi:hypothetical protein